MWEYIIFVILQALSLAGGQAMFKLFVDKLGEEGWAYQNLRATSINNWWVLALMVLFFEKWISVRPIPCRVLVSSLVCFWHSFCFKKAYPSPAGLAWYSS